MKKLGLLVGVIALAIVVSSCDEKAKEYTGTYQGDMISAGKTIKSDAKIWIGGVTENQVYLDGLIPLTKQSDGVFTGSGEALATFIKMFYSNEQLDKIENANITATFSDDVLDMKMTYDVVVIGVPVSATAMSFNGKKISKENKTQE
ncbi:MAG: hypothetical protein LBR36_08065 [Bacteroidales bacterium]|jgi:hypothetical protein|nr:hypothetical protein [Bacteroidales bacterium]